jgi:hypothetical protein
MHQDGALKAAECNANPYHLEKHLLQFRNKSIHLKQNYFLLFALKYLENLQFNAICRYLNIHKKANHSLDNESRDPPRTGFVQN